MWINPLYVRNANLPLWHASRILRSRAKAVTPHMLIAWARRKALIKTILILLSVVLLFIVFTIGRRWEAYRVRSQLLETGSATSRWGDHSKIKIVGTVEDI